MMNILVTGAFKYSDGQISTIKDLGFNVFYLQEEKNELPCSAQSIDAVVGNGIFLYHKIEDFTELKFIQLTSAGFDRIPMEYVKSHGIQIYNARGVYSIPMAEWAISNVLDIYKKTGNFRKKQDCHEWKKQRDLIEINAKKVGILGAGNIGQEVAKRFSAFGAHVVGFDVKSFKHPYFDDLRLISELEQYLPYLDIVVLTLPLLDSTRHLLTYERLQQMKDHSILVNISRGAIIDEKALVQSLFNGKPGYAALDVFEEEPLSIDSPLWNMPNVFVSPHNSFVSDGNSERMFNVILCNLKAFISKIQY